MDQSAGSLGVLLRGWHSFALLPTPAFQTPKRQFRRTDLSEAPSARQVFFDSRIQVSPRTVLESKEQEVIGSQAKRVSQIGSFPNPCNPGGAPRWTPCHLVGGAIPVPLQTIGLA